MLASVEPDGRNSVSGLLVEGAGPVSKALEVCVVTSGLTPRLADRLLQRSVSHRGASLVYVDSATFATGNGAVQPAVDARAQIARLEHAGIAVCVLRRGDALADRLGPALSAGEAVG
jgi:hypothetical protein